MAIITKIDAPDLQKVIAVLTKLSAQFNEQKLIDLAFLDSKEFYALEKQRPADLTAEGGLDRLVDTYLGLLEQGARNGILVIWLIEALFFKYGFTGLAAGLVFLDKYVAHILKQIADYSPEEIDQLLNQLGWLGSQLMTQAKTALIVEETAPLLYTVLDFDYIRHPNLKHALFSEEEYGRPLKSQALNEVIMNSSMEFMQAFLAALKTIHASIQSSDVVLTEIFASGEFEAEEAHNFYNLETKTAELIELYEKQLALRLAAEEETVTIEADEATLSEAVVEGVTERGDITNKIQECINFLQTHEQHSPVIILLQAAQLWLNMTIEQIMQTLMQNNSSIEQIYMSLRTMQQQPPPHMGGGGYPSPHDQNF